MSCDSCEFLAAIWQLAGGEIFVRDVLVAQAQEFGLKVFSIQFSRRKKFVIAKGSCSMSGGVPRKKDPIRAKPQRVGAIHRRKTNSVIRQHTTFDPIPSPRVTNPRPRDKDLLAPFILQLQ